MVVCVCVCLSVCVALCLVYMVKIEEQHSVKLVNFRKPRVGHI